MVVAYSVITHLLDEEIFEYSQEARRVLKPGGVAIFSFLDLDAQRDQFFTHARVHRRGHGDLLKFCTRESLRIIGAGAGFETFEFIGGFDHVPTSGVASRLIPQPPKSFHLGQAVCVLS